MARVVHAYVGLGSNVGDRRQHLDGAVRGMGAALGVRVRAVSRWFETAPVGGPAGQRPYLNGVAVLDTTLRPHTLLERLQALEKKAGRDRSREERHGPRTLDLDLLLFGGEHISAPDLTVPHPELERREFVLLPLATVAPGLLLPSGGTALQVLARLRGASAAEDPHADKYAHRAARGRAKIASLAELHKPFTPFTP